MRNFKHILICISVIFVLFKPLVCMENHDIEMGKDGNKPESLDDLVIAVQDINIDVEDPTSSNVQPASSVPERLTAKNKTDSPGVIIHLGDEKFNTPRIAAFYDPASKTLDLSHKPLGDEGLKKIFTSLKHCIEECEVENLFLENMGLTEIPHYLITYVMLNKHLKIVSLQHNNFNLPGFLSDDSNQRHNSLSVPPSHERKSSTAEFISHMASIRPQGGTSGVVAEIFKGFWEHISSELEKQVEEQDLGKESLPSFKKIILIDRRIPPVIIFDQNQELAPKSSSKCDKIKRWTEWVISAVVGAFVCALPQIIELVKPEDPAKCDMDMLHKLQQACNATRSKPQNLSKSDTDMLHELELVCKVQEIVNFPESFNFKK
jgi:hypothetical protein